MSETHAQIVATIGPLSGTAEMSRALIDAHMNVARLNFSWGTHDEHARYIENIRSAAREAGVEVPIIQDLSGPRAQSAHGHALDPALEAAGSILTEKDLRDLVFGLEQRVEYVCMSYVRDSNDVAQLRAHMAQHTSVARIIAKIERKEAVEHADELIASTDAIMIGRGDLGLSVPVETIPFIERDLISRANAAGKPVIVATQMLASMIDRTEPTRAEVTDIAYAIVSGADAIMLSDETAKGAHPLESVQYMERIALEAEKHVQRVVNRL